MTDILLTPTEDLMLDALVGRYRLGENLWTFESRHSRTARSLEAKGLVHWKSGIVEDTIMVFLTAEAKKKFLSFKYVPPLVRGIGEGEKRAKKIWKDAK